MTPSQSTAKEASPGASAGLARILDRLHSAKHIAIFTHQRPDPDALGSQAAAAIILSRLGAREIHMMQFMPPPAQYCFLLDNTRAKTTMYTPEWASGEGATVDTILVVDTCTYQQLEPAQEFLKTHHAKVAGLDHHLSREPIGDAVLLYADTSAAACVEILWQMAQMANMTMDPALALPLLSGLVGDTGWFRFDSVTPRTHMMAADLVRHVDPSNLYERLMQNETKPKLGLMQRALAGLRWSFDDKFAAMLLRHTDFTETGATQSQTEYLVDMPMMIKTVEVVALMSEMPDGRVRVSLRSKRNVDVNRICNQFEGGGHAKAAGCRLEGPLDAAHARLADAVGKTLGG